ncbi:tyrosine-type recombinase/integrase [Pseudomonas sp. GM55]|uniref:tyrosine-type recombinase/integrase n=1 Tax=Pseudomonas sp. GM55 TaxID=1144333 RepID=UPI0002E416F9|nr:tyrosine-type recombinase/integrase [Pseudomonas sp. GM55]
MKNFRYKKLVIAGQSIDVLESLEGEIIECVEEYVRRLFSSNAPVGTVETYTPCVCKYLDFTVECMAVMATLDIGELSKYSVVELYFQALSFGRESELEIVQILVERLGWSILSSATMKIHRSALTLFFQLSEKWVESSLATVGLDEYGCLIAASTPTLISHVPKVSDFDYKRKGWGSRRVNSYLAECIAGGVGVKALNLIPQYFVGGSTRNVGELKLNLDDVVRVIEQTRNIRDKVYYSLLAAGGARVSETLQVLISDIDVENKIVYIVDPRDRKKLYQNMGLSMSQINSLRFKGRANQRLTLIEPFATMFWNGLQTLLSSPQLPCVDSNGLYITHDFLFCVSRGATKGKPFCLVDPSPILRTFKSNLKKIGVFIGKQHDVRHMYISYLCNDIPTENGCGLGVEKTSGYVGHINIESTEIYNHADSSDALMAAEDFYIVNGYYENIVLGSV